MQNVVTTVGKHHGFPGRTPGGTRFDERWTAVEITHFKSIVSGFPADTSITRSCSCKINMAMIETSTMFVPHQNLSDQVNGNIIRSEIEGGVYLKDLPEEATLEVVTRNRGYKLVV